MATLCSRGSSNEVLVTGRNMTGGYFLAYRKKSVFVYLERQHACMCTRELFDVFWSSLGLIFVRAVTAPNLCPFVCRFPFLPVSVFSAD